MLQKHTKYFRDDSAMQLAYGAQCLRKLTAYTLLFSLLWQQGPAVVHAATGEGILPGATATGAVTESSASSSQASAANSGSGATATTSSADDEATPDTDTGATVDTTGTGSSISTSSVSSAASSANTSTGAVTTATGSTNSETSTGAQTSSAVSVSSGAASVSSASSTTATTVPAFSGSLETADDEEVTDVPVETVSSSSSSQETLDIDASLTGNTLLDVPENTHPTFAINKDAEIRSADELKERITVKVIDPLGNETVVENVAVEDTTGEYLLTLEPTANFVPGKYHVKAELDETRGTSRRVQRMFRILFTGESGDKILFEQDFTWGVLAFNPDRSKYLIDETANIHMGVLDDTGKTLCDASVTVRITDPNGNESVVSTEAGTIIVNPDCKDKAVTYIPDYKTSYTFTETGVYTFAMTANTSNGVRTMSQEIEVVNTRLLDVHRSSATRIYPLADYEMKVTVTPSHTFIGTITETVPMRLSIVDVTPTPREIKVNEDTQQQIIVWNDRLYEAGEPFKFRYTYDAPDISPEFYLLGPLKAEGDIKFPLAAPVEAPKDIDAIESSSSESSEASSESSESSEAETGTGSSVTGTGSSTSSSSATGATVESSSSVAESSVSSTGSTTATGTTTPSVSTSSGTTATSSSSEVSSSSSSEAVSSSSSEELSSSSDASSEESSVSSESSETSSESSESSAASESSSSEEVSVLGRLFSWIVQPVQAQQTIVKEISYTEPRQWQIASDAVINISGRAFSDNGTTGLGSVTIKLSNNGATPSTTTTNAEGYFTFTGVTSTGGALHTLFIDGETEKAVTVMLGSGTTMTGVHLYNKNLIVRGNSDTTKITNAQLAIADNLGGVSDTDVSDVYTISGNNVTTKPGYALRVFSGNAGYAPGGTVAVGSGITIQSPFTMGTNAVTLSGSWTASGNGSFTGTNLVTMDGNSAGTRTITSNGSSFSGVTLAAGSSALYQFGDTADLKGSLTMNSGTFTIDGNDQNIGVRRNVSFANSNALLGNGTWTVGGNWAHNTSTGTFNDESSTLIMNGTGTIMSATNNMALNNVTFNGNVTLNNHILIEGTMTVSENVTLIINSGYTIICQVNNCDLKVETGAVVGGDGKLTIGDLASISQQDGIVSTANFNVARRHHTVGSEIAPGVYNSANVEFANYNSFISTNVLQSGTYVFGGNLTIKAGSSGDYDLDLATNDPTVIIKGNFTIQRGDTGFIDWIPGDNPLIFSGSNTQYAAFSGETIGVVSVNKPSGSVIMTETGSISNLTIQSGTFAQNGQEINVTGDLSISGGTFNNGTGSLSLSGNLLNTGGTFTAATNGTVTLTGHNQTLSGSNTFYNLTKNVSIPSTLTLAANETQTVNGLLTLSGADVSNLLSIRSVTNGVQANIDLDAGGTQSLAFLDVKDNNATGEQLVCDTDCTDSGNNTNWDFGTVPTETVTGKVYTDEGTTSIGANKTVGLSIDGDTVTTVETDAGGQFAFTGVSLGDNAVINVFLKNEAETGATVVASSGSNMTGISIYQNHLIVRNYTGAIISTENLKTADDSGDASIAAVYKMLNTDELHVQDGYELYVWPGTTFNALGRVFTHDLDVPTTATLTMAANGLTASGSFSASGTFTTSTGVYLTSYANNETLNAGNNSFTDLTLDNGLVGYWKLDAGTGAGVAIDSSRYGNDGTLTSIVGSNWRTGVSDLNYYNPSSMYFDGSSDFVSIGSPSALTLAGDMTVSAWMKFDNITGGGFEPIVCDSNLGLSSINFCFGVVGLNDSTGIISVFFNNTTSSVGGTSILNENTWYHVTFTRSGTSGDWDYHIYVDGAVDKTSLGESTNPAAQQGLAIGATGPDAILKYEGSIDDVRMYNRALSATEIASIGAGNKETGSGVYTLQSALDVNNDLGIYAGTLDVSGSNRAITLGGNFANEAGFTPRSGTVTLDGDNQTVTGSTIFHNLTKSVSAARTLFFDHTAKQSISGALTLAGTSSFDLSLRSTKSGSASNLLLDGDSGTQSLSYLDVQDNDASGGTELSCTTGCTEGSNLTNWNFTAAATQTINGTVSDNNGGNIGAGKTVAVSLNGEAAATTDETDANGEFTLTALSMTAGTIVTLFLDNETEDAVTVTLGSGGSMTGIDLTVNALTVQSESGTTALTTDDLAIADNTGDSDITSVYTISSDVLNVQSGFELLVNGRYTPTDAVNVGSGITIATDGIFTMGSNAVTLSGSWLNSGSFTGTNLVTFDGNSSASRSITTGGSAFSGVTIAGGSSASYTFADDITMYGNLNLSSGTWTFNGGSANVTMYANVAMDNNIVNLGSSVWNMHGNWDHADTGTFNSDTSTIIMIGTRTMTTDEDRRVYNLTISGSTTLSGELGANANTIVGTGSTFTHNGFYNIFGEGGKLFVHDGGTLTGPSTLVVQNGEVVVNDGSITSTTLYTYGTPLFAAGFYNPGTFTFVDLTGTVVFGTGTVRIGSNVNVLAAASQAFTIDTSTYNSNLVFDKSVTLNNSATWTRGTGTITFSGSTAATFTPAQNAFEDITINKPSSTLTLLGTGSTTGISVEAGTFRHTGNDFNIANDITVASGATYDAGTGTVTLSGSILNSGTYTTASGGSLVLEGTNQTLSGSNTFYDLTKLVTSADTLTLAHSQVQNISGAMLVAGALGNLLSLRSTLDGTQAQINLDSEGTQSLSYLDVQDNNATGETLSCTTSCTDSGNNTNWVLPGIETINGTVYDNLGGNIGAGKTVAASLNGGAVTSTGSTDANGEYTITGLTMTAGTIVALFLDDETEDAVTVTLGSGGSMTGINLTVDALTVQSESGTTALTTDDLAIADNTGDSDITSVYTVSSDVLNVKSGFELLINGRYTPTDAVNVGSGITIETNGIFTMGSNAVTLSGSWLNSGSFTGTNLVTFDGSAANIQITSNGESFSGISIVGAGTVALSDTLTVNGPFIATGSNTFSANDQAVNVTGDLTLHNSTTNVGAGTWTIGGSINNAFVGTWNKDTGTFVLNGTGNTVNTGNDYYNFTLEGGVTLVDYIQDGDNDLLGATNELVIGTGAMLTVPADTIVGTRAGAYGYVYENAILKGAGDMQVFNSTLSKMDGTCTVGSINVFGTSTLVAATYDCVITGISVSGFDLSLRFGTGTFVLNNGLGFSDLGNGTSTVRNDIYNPNLIFSGSTSGITYSGATGTFGWTKGDGTITFNGTGNQGIQTLHDGFAFEDLVINKASNGVTMTGTGSFESITLTDGTFTQDNRGLVVSGDIAIEDGTYASSTGALTVSGSILNENGSFTNNGTVTLSGGNQTLSGSLTFDNLTKTVLAARTLTIQQGSTTTVSGALTLAGTASNLLSLRSSVDGTQANINLLSSGTQSLQYLDVQDNNASGETLTCASNTCTDSGNNTNWFFLGDGTIKGYIWNDENGDGTRDGTETSGFSGITVTVAGTTGTGASITETGATVANGYFAFSGITISNSTGYTVSIDTGSIPSGYLNTTFTSSGSNVLEGFGEIDVLFGYVEDSTLTGSVFLDSNEDGTKDSGETTGFSGAIVSLSGETGTGDTLSRTTQTNASGTYTFGNLPTSATTFTLVVTPPTGYEATTTSSRSVSFGTGGQTKVENIGMRLETVESSSSSSAGSTTTTGGGGGGGLRSSSINIQIRNATETDTTVPTDDTVGTGDGIAGTNDRVTPEARELAREERQRRDERQIAIAQEDRAAQAEVNRLQQLADQRRQDRLGSLITLETVTQPLKPIVSITDSNVFPDGTTRGIIGMARDTITDIVREKVQDIAKRVTDAVRNTTDYAQKSAGAIAQVIQNHLGATTDAVTDAAGNAIASTVSNVAQIASGLREANTKQQENVQIAKTFVHTTTQRFIRDTADYAEVIALSIGNVITKGLDGTGAVGRTTVAVIVGLGSAVSDAFNTVGSAANGTTSIAREFAETANIIIAASLRASAEVAGESIATAFNNTVDTAGTSLLAMVQTQKKTANEISERRNRLATTITDTSRETWNAMRDTGESFVERKEYVLVAINNGAGALSDFLREGSAQTSRYVAHMIGGEDTQHGAAPDASHVPIEYRTKIRKEGDNVVIAALHMNVLNTRGEPYAHTPVVLFSEPKLAVTSSDGVATFHGVEAGTHTLEIHISESDVETREIVIQPPSGIKQDELVTEDVVLPVVRIVVSPTLRGASPNENTFPPLALLLITLLAIGNLYTVYNYLRKKKNGSGKSGSPQKTNWWLTKKLK